MSLDLGVLFTTFVLILPAELPDKSFVASIVLASRLSRSAVWVGATAAFGIQMAIAVTAGQLLTALPRIYVLMVVIALFSFGAFLLLRQGFRGGDDDDDVEVKDQPKSWWRSALLTFGLLFAAEWGDLTQLIAAAQSARTDEPLSVGLGAWVALMLISALGVSVGKWLQERISVRMLNIVAGSVMLVIDIVVIIELSRTV